MTLELVQSINLLAMLITAAVLCGLAWYGLRHRRAPGGLAGAAFAASLAGWAVCELLIAASTPDSAIVFEAPGRICANVAGWLALWASLSFVGAGRAVTATCLALAAPPVLWLLATFGPLSDSAYLFCRYRYEHVGLMTLQIMHDRGPMFWPVSLFSWSLVVIGVLVVFAWGMRTGSLGGRQALLICAGATLGLALVVLSAANGHATALDYRPLGIGAGAICIAYASWRSRLLTAMPVARRAVFETLHYGIVAVDAQGRVVDLNPAMARILGMRTEAAIGLTTHALLAGIEGPPAPLAADASGARLRLGERLYDLRIVPMRGAGAPRGGRLMIFRDVTMRLQAARERLRRVEELRSMSAHVLAARGGLPGDEPVP
jgi:PAS domain-containing protein